MATNKKYKLYQFKIKLEGVDPPVWRRFQILGSKNLLFLHDVIQIVMGWEDIHLHSFILDDQEYRRFVAEDDEYESFENEEEYTIDQLFSEIGQEIDYYYNLEAVWLHTLELEAIEELSSRPKTAICLGGERACPPENIDGVFAYKKLLEVLGNPKHTEHKNIKNWHGEGYDPEAFNLQFINDRLNKMGKGYSIKSQSNWYQHDLYVTTELYPLPDNPLSKKLMDMKTETRNHAPREDMLTLLKYIQKNKVIGTASKGNFPLKDSATIARKFVIPIEVERFFGHRFMRIQSEEEIPLLYFYHRLAHEAGLITGGERRQWQLSPLGEVFFKAKPAQQIWHMFKSYWEGGIWQSVMKAITSPDSDEHDIAIALVESLINAGPERLIDVFQFLKANLDFRKLYEVFDGDKSEVSELFDILIYEGLIPLSNLHVIELHEIAGNDHSDNIIPCIRSTEIGNLLLKLLAGYTD